MPNPESEMAPPSEGGATPEVALKPHTSAADADQKLPVLSAALAYAAAGLSVFPCRFAPGQDGHKAPLTARGYKDATTDPAQIAAWWVRHPRALIGMPTGGRNGFAVLDLDRKNGKDGFAAVPGWQRLSQLRARTGGGGAHVFFRADRPIRSTSGRDGVDVRGEGGYVIVPPSTGYAWESGERIEPSCLPPFPAAYLPTYHAPDPSDEGLLADDPLLVAAALRAIPNPDEDWDDWNRVGMATFAATGGDDAGFDAWDAWSSKSDKYDPRQTRARWDRFFRSPPTHIGFGSLFYMASEADPDWLDRFELEQEAAALASFEIGQVAFLDMVRAGRAAPESGPAPNTTERADTAGGESAGEAVQPDADPSPEGRKEQADKAPDAPPPDAPTSLLGEWDAGGDDYIIPPRAWLLGNTYCRQFVSSLLATGGGGKTAMRIAQALACATGRQLTGETVFQRCRVLYVSLEDDVDELRRRVLAARMHHGIRTDELTGYLFLAAPGQKAGKLVTSEPAARGRKATDGRVRAGAMLEEVRRTIRARKIDLLLFDPLVKTHDVEENDNNAMDFVISTLTELAIEHNIAVDILHHTSKGTADPGNADRGRGASAVNNGARLVYTLSTMSQDEARTFNVAENERRAFIRIDSGKVNIAPPLRDAKWFQIVGVNLRNGNHTYQSGDNVQTVEPWTPPDTWDGATDDIRERILSEIEEGVPAAAAPKGKPGSRYSKHHNSAWRTAWPVVLRHLPDKSERQCKDMINEWVRLGTLIEDEYADPNTSQKAKGLRRFTAQDERNAPM